MKCFNHRDSEALGTCRICGKGICELCLHDSGRGISCNTKCVETLEYENDLYSQSIEKRNIYRKDKHPSPYVLLLFLMSFWFLGDALYSYIILSKLKFWMLLVGISILGIAIYTLVLKNRYEIK